MNNDKCLKDSQWRHVGVGLGKVFKIFCSFKIVCKNRGLRFSIIEINKTECGILKNIYVKLTIV